MLPLQVQADHPKIVFFSNHTVRFLGSLPLHLASLSQVNNCQRQFSIKQLRLADSWNYLYVLYRKLHHILLTSLMLKVPSEPSSTLLNLYMTSIARINAKDTPMRSLAPVQTISILYTKLVQQNHSDRWAHWWLWCVSLISGNDFQLSPPLQRYILECFNPCHKLTN